MPTYTQLVNSSFTDVVVPFVTHNGMNDNSTTLQKTLTGYTLDVTRFTFTPVVSALKGTYIGASMDKLIWDFGDGTTDTGFTVSKHYKYPGEYEVSIIITDQNGVTHRNRAKQKIKVSNYIPDALMWYTPTIAATGGGLPERCLCGQPSNDLTLYRYNSWQSWDVVSGDGGYYINLYSQGSRSRPLTRQQYIDNPDSHFTPCWRFIKDKTSTIPLERVQTDTNQHVFVKLRPDGTLIHTSETDPDCTFAGTSGYTTVNYLDDNANKLTSSRRQGKGGGNLATIINENIDEQDVEDRDIVLYASFDTSKFPVTRYDDDMSKYEILKQDYFQIYETQKIGLPIQVKFSTPRKLSITSNGISNFNISENKYNNSPMSVSIRTASLPEPATCIDFQNPEFIVNEQESILVTDDMSPLSSSWDAPSWAFSGNDITTDVLTAQGFVSMYLSGEDSDFYDATPRISSDIDFKTWDVGTLKPVNQASSFVRLLITKHDGTPIPAPVGRVVSLLVEQLSDGSRRLLSSMKRSELVYGTGKPNWWETKSGLRYYAYLSPESRYTRDESVEMNIIPAPMKTKTHGTFNSYVNLDTSQNTGDFTKKYRIVGSTYIDPPLYFNYDVLYYYLCNPSNDVIHQIKPVYYRTYSYGDNGFTQTYPSPIITQTPGNSGLYGFAVDPTGNMITVDGDTDRILRNYRNMSVRDELDIYSLLPDVSANHYPGDPDEYGYSPSSVSIDECLDYWVTLYDAVSTIKISGKTNKVLASAVPPFANDLVQSRSQSTSSMWTSGADFSINSVSGPQGEYGENLITPTIVETCKNNDIIVTYTNPVCSFMCRYDSNGVHKHTFELGEDRQFTGDLCIDSSDHVWAVTDGTGLLPSGQPDMNPPRGEIYALDEQLNFRFSVSSLSGTDYQDMRAPVPHSEQQYDLTINMNQYWNHTTQSYVASGLLIDGYASAEPNPKIRVFEGNTYSFTNIFYNRGEHAMVFQNIADDQIGTIPLSAPSYRFSLGGVLWTENVSGYTVHDPDVISKETITINIGKDFPEGLLLVDYNNPANRLVLEVVAKDPILTREADTFDMINNPSHVIPDNNNNIWFSWGNRFCSRYNVSKDTIDTTVAVGSAYYDPRYHPLSAHMHDRRDNADRRQSIEGLSMDTANNLLVVNNPDKKLYALNSDVPTVSAYIKIDNYQKPYESFHWMRSVSGNATADEQDFLTPSHLTDEQINAFLRNVNIGSTHAHRVSAYNEYIKTMQMENGDIKFRTSHAMQGLTAVGLEQEIRALGDWTGYRWINKYDPRVVPSDATTGMIALTGYSAEFTLLPQTSTHDIVKTGEDIDFAGVLREYMQQPILREKSIIYDNYINSIFGTRGSDSTAIGKRVYEKITNYVRNHSDIDTCTLQALHGMADMVNYKLEKLDSAIPAELIRNIDLLSIKLSRLIGTQTNYQSDFEKYGNYEQQSVGVNLGSELVFIFDYDPERSYPTGDYVHYAGEYYQSNRIISQNTPPAIEDKHNWTHWPDGLVYSRSRVNSDKVHLGKTPQEKQEIYDNQTVILRLSQNIKLDTSQKYVLKEEFSGKYNIVRPMAISFPEERHLRMENTEAGFVVTDLNNRLEAEVISDITYTDPPFTIEDKTVTVIDNTILENPTINLFTNRVYEFEIDSPDHPVYITTQLGVSSSALFGYVSNQGTEFGTMTLKTYDDPLYNPLPTVLYYQSGNDPKRSGVIRLNELKDMEGYSASVKGLSSYNLNLSVSSHDVLDAMGWGMEFPEGQNGWAYYRLYEYNPTANEDQEYLSNIINWNDDSTTNTRSYDITKKFDTSSLVNIEVDAHHQWTRDGGDMDIMIEKTLRQGLGMFSGITSLNNYVTGR